MVTLTHIIYIQTVICIMMKELLKMYSHTDYDTFYMNRNFINSQRQENPLPEFTELHENPIKPCLNHFYRHNVCK